MVMGMCLAMLLIHIATDAPLASYCQKAHGQESTSLIYQRRHGMEYCGVLRSSFATLLPFHYSNLHLNFSIAFSVVIIEIGNFAIWFRMTSQLLIEMNEFVVTTYIFFHIQLTTTIEIGH